ncbi:MAG: RNA polymerase sporulation sigma factor SigH [Anaerosomatales bacterium]|nr:RNA polymerase sporulation sigma factor SigH [Anaerosomatales bacterium]
MSVFTSASIAALPCWGSRQGRDVTLQSAQKHPRRRLGQADEEIQLIQAAQAGDDRASTEILRRYRGFVRCKARSYFLAGADREDVIQEGMIGLYKAIRDYDPSKQSSFRSFAELCVTRQLITAIKSATRQKHAPLNSYVSLSRTAGPEEEGERVLADILAVREVCDPAELVISAWEATSIREGFLSALSPFESEVLRLYVNGKSYQEVADTLGRHTKAVDNAIQRIKRKVEIQVERCRAC